MQTVCTFRGSIAECCARFNEPGDRTYTRAGEGGVTYARGMYARRGRFNGTGAKKGGKKKEKNPVRQTTRGGGNKGPFVNVYWTRHNINTHSHAFIRTTFAASVEKLMH